MMYRDTSVPQEQAADAVMTALYHQLDDHELGDDSSFDVYAGLQQLADRIRQEAAVPAPAVTSSPAIWPGHPPARLRAGGARRRQPPRHRMPAPSRYPRQHLAAAVAVAVAAAAAVLIIAIGRTVSLPPSATPGPAFLSPRTVPGTVPIAVLPLRPGQAQMSTEDKDFLIAEISTIPETPATRIKVTSYADGRGTSTDLAKRRAENVAAFLKEKGINASMIQVQTAPFPGKNNADTVVVTWSNPPSSATPAVSSTPAVPKPPAPASPTPTVSPTLTTSSPAPSSAPTTPAPNPTTSASPASPASPASTLPAPAASSAGVVGRGTPTG